MLNAFTQKLNLPVEEFTTPDPITADENASVDALLEIMTQYNVRHIPIMKDGVATGIISQRDLKVIQGLKDEHKNLIKASDIMAKNPVTVSCSETLDEVAFTMSQEKIGSVLVNDDNGLLGIFTVTDALNALIEVIRSAR
ncbi:MAG: CBS domain-containing protein [Bdellovibrionaceae bacterium]|nr:CBS domain-containing protein [Pseudobdellovibrionaceae bacterium]MCO5114612.1 CBS domain-containing protein [Pseudobdellovibrionaceae bacterium]